MFLGAVMNTFCQMSDAFLFFAWFAYVCLNFISGQLVGLKKWRFPKSWGYPKSSKSLDHDLE